MPPLSAYAEVTMSTLGGSVDCHRHPFAIGLSRVGYLKLCAYSVSCQSSESKVFPSWLSDKAICHPLSSNLGNKVRGDSLKLLA